MWRTFNAKDQILQRYPPSQLSEGGALATQSEDGFSLMTTGTKLTEGRHYWEVELVSYPKENCNPCTFIGIHDPNLGDTDEFDRDCTDGWFIFTDDGSRWFNQKGDERYEPAGFGAGEYNQGDRVGVLLDLNDGSLYFFKNGVKHGPGHAAGSVTGPVVAAVHMCDKDTSVRLLPNAEAPASA